jgi:hypothetical protein
VTDTAPQARTDKLLRPVLSGANANLPDPEVLALEIAEELEAALEQSTAIRRI